MLPSQNATRYWESKIKEEWLDIEGYEQVYQVSNKGRVRSINGIVKQHLNQGYYKVVLKFKKVSKTFLVHRLVAMQFVKGNKGKTVNHIDGCKINNNADNLEWVTSCENTQHAILTGLHPKKVKLTIEDIKIIKKLCSYKCFTYQRIANYFDVSENQIYRIAKGLSWKNVEFDHLDV